VHFTIDARRVRAEGTASADKEAVPEAGEGLARVDPGSPVKAGERATSAIKTDGMQFFDPDSGKAIWTRPAHWHPSAGTGGPHRKPLRQGTHRLIPLSKSEIAAAQDSQNG
jgi:hypothetical protein